MNAMIEKLTNLLNSKLDELRRSYKDSEIKLKTLQDVSKKIREAGEEHGKEFSSSLADAYIEYHAKIATYNTAGGLFDELKKAIAEQDSDATVQQAEFPKDSDFVLALTSVGYRMLYRKDNKWMNCNTEMELLPYIQVKKWRYLKDCL